MNSVITGNNSDSEICKLVSGKEVALVGPASSIQGKKNGAKINSFDLTIRVNQHFELNLAEQEDYGTRNDILITNFNVDTLSDAIQNEEFIKKYSNIIFLVYKNDPISKRIESFSKKINKKFIRDEYTTTFTRKILPKEGHTGVKAIILLLENNVKKIYLTGFSFYNMNNFGDVYYNRYNHLGIPHKFKGRTKKSYSSNDLSEGRCHNTLSEIDLFRKIYKENNDRILLDDYLKIHFEI